MPILTSHAHHTAQKRAERAISGGQIAHRPVRFLCARVQAIGYAIVLLVIDFYTINIKIFNAELARRHPYKQVLDAAYVLVAYGK